jgi:plastocyanin
VKINKQKSCFSWFLSLLLFLPSFVDAYEEITVTTGGTIRGIVKMQGKAPKLAPLKVTKFKEVCRNVPDESLIVGPSQGIRYAVVTLEGVSKGKPIEKESVHELDNVKCRFVPHVVVASVGQFLLLKNSDPILHTAHAYFKDQPHFNVGMYPGRVSRKPLAAAGTAKVICEVHPWMSAYLVITDHPYYAVTDVYGEYEIGDVPAGTYKLKVWHEKLGLQETQVEVKAGATSKVDFDLSLPREVKK